MVANENGVVGYVRVSTEEQASAGVSLAAQRTALERYAKSRDLRLVSIFEDGGVSASVPLAKRAAGAELLRAIGEDGVDGVVAMKLDRLFRDAIDALETTRMWDRDGITLHLVDMQIDTRSAMGRMFLTVMAALAEMERGLIAERTAAALAQVKAEGGRIGPEGFGWTRGDELDEHGRRVVVPLDDELAVIDRIVVLRNQDFTYQQIADDLTNEGVATKRGGRWYPGTVRRLLLRSGCGDLRHRRAS